MRVTQSMLANNTLRHISQGYDRLGRLQEQLATQKKISRASQDPVVAMKGMRFRSEVTEVEQFKRNLSEVYSWMDNSDSALDKTTQAIHRIRELVVQASNDTYESSQRSNMAKEIQQIAEHIESLANTKVNGKFIFNGTNTTNPPVNIKDININMNDFQFDNQENFVIQFNNKQFKFNAEENAFVNGNERIVVAPGENGPEVTHQIGDGEPTEVATKDLILSDKKALSTNEENVKIEVMKGIFMPVNTNPQNVFSAEMFADLKKVIDVLTNPSSTGREIEKFLDRIDVHANNVVNERAELGARMNRVEMIEIRIMEQEIIAKKSMSENEDADAERLIMDLIAQESVHRAALASGARLMQPSLLDFLR
ncbi:flagellar hook-associated protein FlgL [Bacillus alkalicellulosilyticus]|uniref:flagellar hook-associated protein FlgL n=1 Tax=Alkalihalobacterium alkalicellulosilyticum TaxID=1912214 RepID=UPI000997D802|nr:flagellar hook-associated protein FlgL [Bacillus alkalicellulosilyticus]